ncbi:type I phosphomannose isomerase catalytic subunit [Hominifimenecus sp. rT4P-3]|uniref:type I phosphomannose isomerase catalytic subunit n=1 Tax=Hominifimenecus sp. rT4P-3 TaxID=3242979 RepID=UPI003DA42A1F
MEPVEKTPIWGKESWVIAAHENGDGIIKNGAWKGRTLGWLWQNHREYFGNIEGDRFPLLIKEITAKADLSIQVHPDNAYAKKHENGASGKSECWYILEAKEDASLIMGHNARNREEAERFVQEGRWKEFLREVPVKAGDFFQIDAGCVHSIKGGIRLLEIQQNSDITYRLYDYDRLDEQGRKRQLHIEKSLDVINYGKGSYSNRFQSIPLLKTCQNLVQTPYYRVDLLKLKNESYALTPQNTFLCLDILQGNGTLESTPITQGMHIFIPCQNREIQISGKLEMILSSPANDPQK